MSTDSLTTDVVSANAETTDDVTRLCGELVIESARLTRAVRRLSEAPAAGVRVLALLDQHGPQSVSRLAGLDRSSQPSMSGAVAILVERGWVAKRVDPDDARAAVVEMTRQGRAELSASRRLMARAVATTFAETSHSLEELTTAVAVVRDVLEAGSDFEGGL